jgi:hypothetical protein
MPHNLAYYKNFKMINLTYMIFISNYVFTVVFYATRWTKPDIACICFEEFIIQLNLLYIYNRTRIMVCPSWTVDQTFFVRPSLAQWAASETFISFYVFNFGVVFFMHIWFVFILSYKKIHHHSIILNFVIQSYITVWGYQLVVNSLGYCLFTDGFVSSMYHYHGHSEFRFDTFIDPGH